MPETTIPRLLRTDRRIATDQLMPIINSAQALPLSVDEAERSHGVGLYDEMIEHVTELDTAYRILRDRALRHGLEFSPGAPKPYPGQNDPAADADYEKAVEIADFVKWAVARVMDDSDTSAMPLEHMFCAVKHGYALLELGYERVKRGPYQGAIGLSEWRCLPRKNASLIFDPFGRLLGANGIVPGQASTIYAGLIPTPEALPGFIPAERCHLFRLNPTGKSVRGASLLRSSYRSYRAIRQMEVTELLSLAQFGGEGLVFTAGPDSMKQRTMTMPDGTTKTASEYELFVEMMKSYTPGTAMLLPPGFQHVRIGGDGNPEGFKVFFDRHARKVVSALLYSATTLMEAQRNSVAQASTSADLTDDAADAIAQAMERSIAWKIVRPLVRLNFGDDLERLSPVPMIRRAPDGDFESICRGLATAHGAGVITKAMLPEMVRAKFGVDYEPDGDNDTEPNTGQPGQQARDSGND